jgi:hypothetical protein
LVTAIHHNRQLIFILRFLTQMHGSLITIRGASPDYETNRLPQTFVKSEPPNSELRTPNSEPQTANSERRTVKGDDKARKGSHGGHGVPNVDRITANELHISA